MASSESTAIEAFKKVEAWRKANPDAPAMQSFEATKVRHQTYYKGKSLVLGRRKKKAAPTVKATKKKPSGAAYRKKYAVLKDPLADVIQQDRASGGKLFMLVGSPEQIREMLNG